MKKANKSKPRRSDNGLYLESLNAWLTEKDLHKIMKWKENSYRPTPPNSKQKLSEQERYKIARRLFTAYYPEPLCPKFNED